MERLTFDQAVELFRLYCRSKGLAPRTVETYMFALEGLREFLAQRCDPPELPQTRDLRAYSRTCWTGACPEAPSESECAPYGDFCNMP